MVKSRFESCSAISAHKRHFVPVQSSRKLMVWCTLHWKHYSTI